MIQNPYKVIFSIARTLNVVSGPGEWTDVMYDTDRDARCAANGANEAYRIGYAHAQADMRRAMGLGPKEVA